MERKSGKGVYRYFVPNNWNVSLAVLITLILGVFLYSKGSRCKLTMCSSFDFLSFNSVLAVIEIVLILSIVYVAVSIATYFTGILKDKSTIKKIIYAIVIFLIIGLLTNAIGALTLLETHQFGPPRTPITPDMSILDIRCYNEEGKGRVRVPLENSGETSFDLALVDLEIHNFADGDINSTLTRRNISLSSNETSKGITTSGDSDISSPGESTVYNITLEKRLEPGKRYLVHFIFKNEEGIPVGRPCEAVQGVS